MDNVFIYNQALTAAQVAGLYVDGMTGKDSNVEYDPAGNMTRDHNGYIYQWDYENHLTSIATANPANLSQPTLLAEFVYDALGRRIRQTVRVPDSSGYIQTDYYYNGWQLLTEVVTDADLEVSTVNYAYGNQLDEVLLYVTNPGSGESISYLLGDHLNSPAARLDSTGTILERYEYDAYGKRHVFNADYSQTFADNVGTNIGFTGQRVEYFDNGNLELGYYKNRWYGPAFGRFLSEDPLGVEPEGYENDFNPLNQYKDGVNVFQYCKSNPECKLDNFGFACFALRPLSGMPWLGLASHNPIDDYFNTECAHEQILFEDGKVPRNSGFFNDSTVKSDDSNLLPGYRAIKCGYNDCVLRLAVAKTQTKPYSLLGIGKNDKFNCQDWAEAVRNTYSELVQDPAIYCKCKVKASEVK